MIPFFQASRWCLNYLDDDREKIPGGIWLDCKSVAEKNQIPYSRIPMASVIFTSSLSVLCLIIFSAIKTIRWKRRKLDKKSKRRDIFFFIMVSAAFVDIVFGLIFFRKDYIADILRPLIIVTCFRSQ